MELLDQAFNAVDLEAVLSFYDANAVVVTEPEKKVSGTKEIREFFEQVMKSGASAKQVKTHVIEVGGIALFLFRWFLNTNDQDQGLASRSFIATTIFRRQPGWKLEGDHR